MKTATLVLTILHLTAIAGAVIAAAVDIESIVVTAIPCSLLGLSAGCAGLWRRNGAVALLGLSTPLVSLSVFLWIYLKSWSPNDAQLPVSAALLGYEVFCLSVGALGAFNESRGGDPLGTPGRMQFRLRSLLLVTFLVAVDLAAVRLAMAQGKTTAIAGIAIGLGLASMVACSAAIVVGHKASGGRPDPRNAPPIKAL